MKRYDVDLSIAERSNVHEYKSFNDFFTRKLLNKFRPMQETLDGFLSPADGKITEYGNIKQHQMIQAKNHYYSVNDLLGGTATPYDFSNGSYITIYLSPKDYHRVHMPITGKLLQMIYVPGKLFSVNNKTVNYIPNIFARNERIICLFKTQFGIMAQILVGAMIVGSIATTWHGNIIPPNRKKLYSWKYDDKKIIIEQGHEMGLFKLGSTVITLFSKATDINWNLTDNEVKVKQLIGNINAKI